MASKELTDVYNVNQGTIIFYHCQQKYTKKIGLV